jgi:hypothetical protein
LTVAKALFEKTVASLSGRLRKNAEDWRRRAKVGYSAPYAVFVHENLEIHHPNGQAKFLEQPFRELEAQLRAMISELVKKRGLTWQRASLMAAQYLLRESQKLVPVRTGYLRDSGFARVE